MSATAITATQSPTELIESLMEPTNRREFRALVAPYARDAVFDTAGWHLGVYEGRERIRRLFEEWIGAFESFHIEVERVTDLGGGVVVAEFRQTVRSPGASSSATLRAAWLYEWRDGQIARVTTFHGAEEACAEGRRVLFERTRAAGGRP